MENKFFEINQQDLFKPSLENKNILIYSYVILIILLLSEFDLF